MSITAETFPTLNRSFVSFLFSFTSRIIYIICTLSSSACLLCLFWDRFVFFLPTHTQTHSYTRKQSKATTNNKKHLHTVCTHRLSCPLSSSFSFALCLSSSVSPVTSNSCTAPVALALCCLLQSDNNNKNHAVPTEQLLPMLCRC